MRIAIVTGHPVPFALGGAENLWWGLQTHLNEHTEHSCDIVSLISPETNFWELVESYRSFHELDLSSYDCVISGKYPAWMVNHPNHVCYILHRLRGLYDTYSGPLLDEDRTSAPEIARIADWMNAVSNGGRNPDPSTIPELFRQLRELQHSGGHEPVVSFPGPFSRAVVHFLDNAALSPGRIQQFAAISETVAKRSDYFPAGVPVEVLYPPPHRDDYRDGQAKYFFTSSRLDRPKRIGMLVDAMRHVRADIELRIAGNGPEKAALIEQAAGDQRIKFLGFVADEDMPEQYMDALAVPFVPYDEDYGLVTIEAMRSGKPVLTTTDAGGPCEFVEHGVTGLVSRPDAESLGMQLDWLAEHPEEARKMGEAAKDLVADIGWAAVADRLLTKSPANTRPARRPKLTVAISFRSFPPRNGGQMRVYQLYKNLATFYDIDLVCLGDAAEARSETQVAPGMVQVVIPRTQAQTEIEHEINRLGNRVPVDDVAAHALAGLTPEFGEALALSALTSEAVIACHPYLVETITQAAPGKPMWYEAQDVEITTKAAALSSAPAALAQTLLAEVAEAERRCWLQAERVFACAQRDLDELTQLYGGTRAHLHEVPNGVAIDEIAYTRPEIRRSLKAGDRPLTLFMGSWHGPNLEALDEILSEAAKLPGVDFAVIGSVCQPFSDRLLPHNVALLGQVDDTTRNALLAVADVALNPMRIGSGTNLKMLDYFAAGVPVLSTSFGARGLDVTAGTHYALIDDRGLAACLDEFLAQSAQTRHGMVDAARIVVEQRYAWSTIAQKFFDELQPARQPLSEPDEVR